MTILDGYVTYDTVRIQARTIGMSDVQIALLIKVCQGLDRETTTDFRVYAALLLRMYSTGGACHKDMIQLYGLIGNILAERCQQILLKQLHIRGYVPVSTILLYLNLHLTGEMD